MSDTHARSLAKAVSWRITGTIDTFLISWLITGRALLAGGIAGTEVLTKVTLFYLHERVWGRVRWGRKEHPSETPVRVPVSPAPTHATVPVAAAEEPARA